MRAGGAGRLLVQWCLAPSRLSNRFESVTEGASGDPSERSADLPQRFNHLIVGALIDHNVWT